MNVVLTVGNSLMGDDGAGPLLAELLTNQPREGWLAIDGGSAPENMTHRIREIAPGCVLIFDASDMGLPTGELRIIDPALIADMFIMSTHNLPLNFLIEQLQETVPNVVFLGVQPGAVAFYCPLTEPVSKAVYEVHEVLREWCGQGPLPWMAL